MNVLASRPDGWWRDREGAFSRLVAELQPLAAARHGRVLVVVEGRAGDHLAAGCHGDLEVVHATRRGADAADDHIVTLLEAGDLNAPTVVTADRELRRRAREAGAEVIGPAALRRALPG